VIGAGSVVTRDIPEGVFAAGNPCRVVRAISSQER
jgi:maltose O-acetyltransferase